MYLPHALRRGPSGVAGWIRSSVACDGGGVVAGFHLQSQTRKYLGSLAHCSHTVCLSLCVPSSPSPGSAFAIGYNFLRTSSISGGYCSLIPYFVFFKRKR